MNTDVHLQKPLISSRLIRLINALLVLWLVWLVAGAAWQYFQPVPETEDKTTPAPPTTATGAKITADQMTDWHLPGIADEQKKTGMRRMPNAPETSLKLSLKGIVATDDHLDGYAIIQKPAGEERHFKVRDSVFGLAKLDEIHVNRVILLRDGRYETLRLPVEFMASDLIMERERKREAKRIVSDFRQKLINRDGMELIKMFGFDTTFRNGGFVGFTIKPLGEEGADMLEVLGVRDGDLITAVNGKRFAESIEATQSLTELKHATEVDVEIDRKGVPMFFHFEFSDLEQTAEKTGGDDANAGSGATPARQATGEASKTAP